MAETVRDMIRGYQQEILETAEMQPDRAVQILMDLSALMANVAEEIRRADALYAQVLLGYLNSEKKANRARIMAEISPEYDRRQEARDTKEGLLETIRSLKVFIRAKSDELATARFQQ